MNKHEVLRVAQSGTKRLATPKIKNSYFDPDYRRFKKTGDLINYISVGCTTIASYAKYTELHTLRLTDTLRVDKYCGCAPGRINETDDGFIVRSKQQRVNQD